MKYALTQTGITTVAHLGDFMKDAAAVQNEFPSVSFNTVKGNSDFADKGDIEKTLIIDGVKIYLTHGHHYHVKEGFSYLKKRAVDIEADLVLYGHTHNASIIKEGNITLFNPGQMMFHTEVKKASYGIITISDGRYECEIVDLPDDMLGLL